MLANNRDQLVCTILSGMMSITVKVLFIFFWTTSLFLRAEAKTLYVVDIEGGSMVERLAALSCQGLMNRNNGNDPEETAVYTIKNSWDQLWLNTAMEEDPEWELLNLTFDEYLSDVCEKENFAKILYRKSIHHETIPQIITVAGVLDAVPLDVDSGMDQISSWKNHSVAFDAGTEWISGLSGYSELQATEYIFDHFAQLTSGVAVMNPGWKQPDDSHPLQHDLVRDPDVGLADFIVKERIFNFFLYTGCIPLTEEHALMRKMMSDEKTSWKKPVEVYGYNDAVHIGGSVFEAETNCIQEHNMGQVASSGQNNFSFFNKRASIQNPDDLEKYLEALLRT